jgi:hydroxymethylbilane synthase
MAQLRALGYGLDVEPIRGNVDTRLRKVAEGEVDAVVLAYAGLSRLGRLGEVTEVLDPLQMLPAPAQGALAVECRLEDPVTIDLLSDLDDTPSRAAVTAERALLAALEAGCSAPVGALAEIAEGDDEGAPEIYLRGVVVSVDGSTSVRLSTTGSLGDAEVIGRRLAADLLAEGASDVMGERVP